MPTLSPLNFILRLVHQLQSLDIVLAFAARRRQIPHDGFERRLRQVCRVRCFRVPEVKLIRQLGGYHREASQQD